MTAAYSEFLRRRGIWHVVEKNKENMSAHPWEIQHFVDELTSYFDSCRTFAEPGDKGVENLTATSRKNAWIAVLNEMVNARRSTSLASLGILKFNYKGNAEEIMSGVAEAYQQKVEDVKALFDLLAMEIVYHGALEGDCDLTDDEREYIFYTPKPKRVKRCKDMDKDKKKSYLAGWSAAIRKNGSLLKNGRLKRVMSVLNLDEASANELLQMYWDEVLRGEESLSTAGNDEFYFSTERFTVSSGTEDIPIYGCDVCGKTTTMNCKDMCTTLKCGGHLRRITHDSLLRIITMQNSINLLSCSRSTLKSIRHSSDARNNKSTRRCSSTKRSMLLAAQRPSRWVLTWVIWRLYTCGICLLHRQTMCKEQDAQVAVKMQRRSHLHMLSSVPTTLPISRIRRT